MCPPRGGAGSAIAAPLLTALLLLASGCGGGEEARRAEPAAGAGDGARSTDLFTNRAPEARCEVFPLRGWTELTRMRFDASLSADDFDPSTELLKRWDFDGDGTWDTPWEPRDLHVYVFPTPGEYRPRLIVKDASGLRDSTEGSLLQIEAPCPAPDFALEDGNPHSPTYGETYRLSALRGQRVLVWFAAPSG